ncbi:MAG: zinc-dependent metalloprotease [Verrucomicrobia bacterium]|nr:zinc-dependent metalloprotease [Verrucomicrobiota bacterium]
MKSMKQSVPRWILSFAIALPACLFAISLPAKTGAITARTPKSSGPATTTKAPAKEEKKPKTIADIVGTNQKFEGLFTLYQDKTNGATHILIKQSQLGKEFIYFTHTRDGVLAAGHFRGDFKDNRIFSLRKHFNRIEFVSENTSFYFDQTNALHRAASANISPAILVSQEIVAEDAAKGEFLIKADPIFLTESLFQVKPSPNPDARPGQTFNLGSLSKDKTKTVSIKNYPANTDVVVEYVYENPAPTVSGGEEVTDPRNVSIQMQHTLIEMPVNDYQPRFDDPRVGYFTDQVTDLTSPSVTPYRDLIHRWHLVKKDKAAKLSEPVEPIVWWIENTTPVELRDTIRDAALAWNEAFEVAGFKNAMVVKVQPDDADWDAGDIRYNVLRWTSSPNPPFGGYGPSFVNPRTGQIIGADIMLEFIYVSNRLRAEKIFSKAGLDLEDAETLEKNFDPRRCSLGHHLHLSTLFGAETLKVAGASPTKVTELIKESLYFLILHELGHTLGLNHNMKSSQLHSPADINNRELTARVGLTGSVMDYPAINLAPPGQSQGQYFTTKPGPYDKWAIEFGYSEASIDPAVERERLAKILARSTEPALAFGNDADDMRAPGHAIDPRVMINDMSSDAITYSAGRIKLANDVMGKIKDRILARGESHQELLNAYFILTSEMASAAATISRYIGGVYVDRGMVGQPNAGAPFTPVSYADQKRALAALRSGLFAPKSFDAPNRLYDFLQTQRRGFNHFNEPEDPKIHARALAIQRNVLNHLLHARVLTRITDSRLYGNTYTLPEFLDDLTNAVFEEDAAGDVNTFRQNLQLEFVNRLTGMIGDAGRGRFDYPTQSIALAKLRAIQKLLATKNAGNAETQAHTAHILFVIEQALKPKS